MEDAAASDAVPGRVRPPGVVEPPRSGPIVFERDFRRRALLVLPASDDDPVMPEHAAAGPLPALLARGGMVVAVDGGVGELRALGCVPDVLVGDLDSAAPDDVTWAVEAGADLRRHPTDKDDTDLALALRMARDEGAEVVDVVGSARGRLDHLLGVVLALTDAALDGVAVAAHLGAAHLAVVHDERHACALDVPAGTTFSLLAPRGARGVTVTGARWPLDDERLDAGSTLGVSNVTDGRARVACREGPLVVVIG